MKNSGHMEVEIEQFLLRWSAGFENDQYFEAARRDIVDLIIKSRAEGRLEGVKAGLEAEHCPDCPDQGWYILGDRNDVDQDVDQQVQCEFCYSNKNSAFNVRRSLPADKIAEEIK